MTTREGTIDGYLGSWLSPLGYLLIDGYPYPCLASDLVQELEATFGPGVIGPDRTVNQDKIVGKRVMYRIEGGAVVKVLPVESIHV